MTAEQATKFDIGRLWELFGSGAGLENEQQLLAALVSERESIAKRMQELDVQILALEMKTKEVAAKL